ncbi:MAG: hypothetical protein AABZ55_06550, partial [Bdellovibrionota bacterium]
VVTGCLLAVLFNFGTIGEIAKKAFSAPAPGASWDIIAFRNLVGQSHFHPIKPLHWFFQKFLNEKRPPYDLGFFFWNLHITSLFIGLVIWGVVTVVNYLELIIQYMPYDKRIISLREWWLLFFENDFRKYYLEENNKAALSEYKTAYKSRLILLSRILNYCRAPLYHRWSILTQTNRYRELLIADVLTNEGDIYSGLFTSYVPNGNDISAISMEYILRYGATADPKNGRPKSLLKNNGELVIPSSQIRTVHFWEIRRNYNCQIVISNKTWNEVLKWYLLLAHLYPKFFNKISVAIPTEEAYLDMQRKIIPWLRSNRLELKPKVLEFLYLTGLDVSAGASQGKTKHKKI